MRQLRLGIALGVLLVFAAVAIAGPPKGLWNTLLTKGAKWTLKNDHKGDSTDQPDSVTVTVANVHKVGTADVVDLDYTFNGGNEEMRGESLAPTRFAITKKGVYVLDADASDEAIAKALKKKPFFAEPPKLSKFYKRKDGGAVQVPKGTKGAACFVVGATDPSCGSAPCYGYICLDATGIVGVSGDEWVLDYGVVGASDNPF
jgi:hypothetical protein